MISVQRGKRRQRLGGRLNAAQPWTCTRVHGPHSQHAAQMLSGPGKMRITLPLKVDQCWVWGSLDPGLLADTEVIPVREKGLFGSIQGAAFGQRWCYLWDTHLEQVTEGCGVSTGT